MDEPYCYHPVRAWPELDVRGFYRSSPEDFQVEECLEPGPAGGEHLWLWVEKRGQNTAWVGQQLARWAGVGPRAIGWAGLKDRQAVTRQWFSIHLPGQDDPPLDTLAVTGVRVLNTVRQPLKLRPGDHAGNAFSLVLRSLRGNRASLEERLRGLAQAGFAHAFGPQRFGRAGGNLRALQQQLQRGRPRRRDGRMISTGRAFLFNEQLRQAIARQVWETGEGWLWGRFHRDHAHSAIQQRLRQQYPVLCHWLEGLGMNATPRPYRVQPVDLHWQWLSEDCLQLVFRLPAGAFATALLAELGQIDEPGLEPPAEHSVQ